jgi:hypothetical protein
MRPLRTTAFVFLCLFVVFLLSGFNLEGNMQPEMEAGNETLPADDEWLLQVEAEKRGLEELPYVKEVGFVYGDTANLCKVLATVWCCCSLRTHIKISVSTTLALTNLLVERGLAGSAPTTSSKLFLHVRPTHARSSHSRHALEALGVLLHGLLQHLDVRIAEVI